MKTPNWLLLAIIAVVGTFVFQYAALNVSYHDLDTSVDIDAMRSGYIHAQQNGTSSWWFGKWINEASPYFRPIASYGHIVQFKILDGFGFKLLTISTLLTYATLCFLCGLVSWLAVNNRAAAYVSTILASTMQIAGRNDWLAYFPYMDGILSVLFSVAAIAAFLRFSHAPRQYVWLTASWVLFIASALSKEAGAFTPVLIVVLVLGSEATITRRRVVIIHPLFMAIAGAFILRYGKSVLGRNGHPAVVSNFWLCQFSAEGWWLIALAASVAFTAVTAWMLRNKLGNPLNRLLFALLSLLVVLSIFLASPRHDLPAGNYALVFIIDNWKVMFKDAAALFVYSSIAVAIVKLRSPWLTLPAVYCISYYPFTASGTAMQGGRLVFLLPFAACASAYCIAVLAESLWRVAVVNWQITGQSSISIVDGNGSGHSTHRSGSQSAA